MSRRARSRAPAQAMKRAATYIGPEQDDEDEGNAPDVDYFDKPDFDADYAADQAADRYHRDLDSRASQ